MSLNKTKILGIGVTTDSKKIILEYIQKYLIQTGKNPLKPCILATPNPEQLVLAQRDPRFAEILNRADVALPDGIGLAMAAGIPRYPGVECMEDLVCLAAARGYRIGLIGGRSGLAVKTLECLQTKYPGLKGWAEDGPEIEIRNQGIRIRNQGGDDAYFRTIVDKIVKTQTKIVFVGLGAPKQEYVIARLARQFQISNFKFQIVMMSVGGSFDFIAGRLKRAPLLIRSIGFEWLWRLAAEPWRWRRQLALIEFTLLVLKQRILRR